ncbi:hypothetical protein Tco_0245898 [Tanacetum coccineum]
MDAFRVLKTQFQLFINFQYYFDNDEGLMIHKYFLAYTRTEVRQFRDTLIQHMEYVKKSIDKRAQHKREYDNRINERQMQSKEGKVDLSKALDTNIRPVNDQVPFAEVDSNTTPDSTNMSHRGGEIDQDAEQYQVKIPLLNAEFFKTKDMVEK